MPVFSSTITPQNVGRLSYLWQFATRSYVTGQPLFFKGKIYIADWQGFIYCLHEKDGSLVYEKQLYQPPRQNSPTRKIPLLKKFMGEPLPYYWSGFAGTGCISGNCWYLASVGGREGGVLSNGAPGRLYAIALEDGSVLWEMPLGDTQYEGSLAPPVCDNENIYAATQSVEEVASLLYSILLRPYKPQSVGQVFAFNKKTGAERWKIKTVELDPADNPNAKGASVWGGLELDTSNKMLYFGTGNNHGRPASKSSDALFCISAQDGIAKWVFQPVPYDAWLPLKPDGPDFDFGCKPILFFCRKSSNAYAVGAGNKNGFFYALDSKNGSILWKTFCHVGTAPDDGIRSDATYYKGKLYVWSRNRGRSMSICCLDADSGAIVWNNVKKGNNAHATGAITNGLYFLSNFSGELFALATDTGKRVWQAEIKGASIGSSLAIYNNRLYGGLGVPALFGGNPDICGVSAFGFQ
ncbi:MAG: PQQ-binding-like beta-propeller repeat protein [Eubacteriales bacterium]